MFVVGSLILALEWVLVASQRWTSLHCAASVTQRTFSLPGLAGHWKLHLTLVRVVIIQKTTGKYWKVYRKTKLFRHYWWQCNLRVKPQWKSKIKKLKTDLTYIQL